MAIIKVIPFFLGFCTMVLLLRLIVVQKKNNVLLYKFCSINIGLICSWTLLGFINAIYYLNNEHYSFLLYMLGTFCEFYTAPVFLIIAIIIMWNELPKKAYLLFLPAVISTFMQATNKYHQSFYENYDVKTGMFKMMKGVKYPYLYFHVPFYYGFIILAAILIIAYTFKYIDSIPKQVLLLFFSSMVPLVILIFSSIKKFLPNFPFSPDIRIIFYLFFIGIFASFRYKFFGVIPYKFKNEIENMRDSFLVTTINGNILDKNKIFIDEFNIFLNNKANNLFNHLKNVYNIKNFKKNLLYNFELAKSEKKQTSFEHEFLKEVKYYNISIRPILIKDTVSIVLIIFKDISDQKKIVKLIEEQTNQLVEKARITSLKNLMGGITHNIKSPLMSSAGGIIILNKQTKHIEQLLKKENIYDKYPECIEVLNEMIKWENTIKQSLLYISDIITAVKDQTLNLDGNSKKYFTVSEIVKKVELLIDFELKKSKCILIKEIKINPEIKIKGDITVLTQILNNLIINSIQAYDDGGNIYLSIFVDGDNLKFVVLDNGKGIAENIKDKIFKQMITTKGSMGTGLGLYISNIALQGHFKGNMNFVSNTSGTKIIILIPLVSISSNTEMS